MEEANEANEAWSKYRKEQKEIVSQELQGDAAFQKWKKEQIVRRKEEIARRAEAGTQHETEAVTRVQIPHGSECFCPRCDYGF